jgi:hypothetical protein
MPQEIYKKNSAGKDVMFYECRMCHRLFHGEQYDLADEHENIATVPGRDFHDVVFMKDGTANGYVLFVRSGARTVMNGQGEKHETLYAECEVDMNRIWPQDNEFARSVATMSSAEIESEIGKNLRPASPEEMKNLNDAVFRRDDNHVHEGYLGTRTLRTL